MKAMRERDLSRPIQSEPEDLESKDKAIAARFNSADPQEAAAMISAAAAKARGKPEGTS